MISFQYMEPLLVRFTKKQRSVIRKASKRGKISEAAFVRCCIEFTMETSTGIPRTAPEGSMYKIVDGYPVLV